MSSVNEVRKVRGETIGYILVLFVLIISLLNTTGWLFDIPLFHSYFAKGIAMRQITAFCLILLSIALLILKTNTFSKFQKSVIYPICIVVSLLGILSIIAYITELHGGDNPFTDITFLNTFLILEKRMALITAVLFLAFSIVLFLLTFKTEKYQGVAHALILAIFITAYFVPVSYLIGITTMYSIRFTAVTFFSGMCFCLLCLAVLLFYPKTWFMKVFSGKYTGGYLARKLLPGIFLVPLLVGWLRINGEKAGLFSADLAFVFVTITYTVFFLLLLWLAVKPVIEIEKKEGMLDEALRKSEEQYRMLVESANSMIIHLDMNGTFKFVNEYTLRFLGYTREEMIGKNVRMIIPEIESTGRNFAALMYEIIKNPQAYPQMENENIKKNGERAWVSWTNRTITDKNGNLEVLTIGTDITHRKKIEQKLEYERELFEGIVNNIPVMITIYDPELKNFRLNKALQNTVGWAEEDAADGNLVAKVFPDPEYRQAVVDFMQSLQPGWKEWVMTSKDGTQVDTSWANINLPSGVQIGIGIDIRERKKAEATLRDNEQRLQGMFHNAAIGIVLTDSEDRFVDVNNRLCEILGYTREELLRKTVSSLTAPEDRSLSDSMNLRLHNGEFDTFDYEKRYLKADGTPVWVHVTVSAVRDSQANHKNSIVTVEDITTRKYAEEALYESEEMFSTMVNVLPIGLALSTFPDRKLYKTNPALLKIIGYSEEDEFLGKTSEELGVIRDFETQKKYLNEFRQNGRLRNLETTIYTKAGAQRIASINLDEVHIRGQKYILATIVDITEQKALEQALKNKNEELTRFIYTVSHDLKSPLVTIKTFTFYLKEDIQLENKEAQEKDMMYIQNAADKMGKLLDELLELSRVGRKEDTKSEVIVKEIAKAAVDLVAGRISQKNAKVIFTGPDIVVFGISQRLLQLYQNLIDNAAKFMGTQPEPLIEIGSYFDSGKKQVVFFVRDNGSGIDSKYRDKVFGLFEKFNHNTEGTGIGLALIKRIVEVHNGTIWFTSEGKDKGTTFYFTLEGSRMIS